MKRGLIILCLLFLLVIPLASANFFTDFMDKFSGIAAAGDKITGYGVWSSIFGSRTATAPVRTVATAPVTTVAQPAVVQAVAQPAAVASQPAAVRAVASQPAAVRVVASQPAAVRAVASQPAAVQAVATRFSAVRGTRVLSPTAKLHISSVMNGLVRANVELTPAAEVVEIKNPTTSVIKCYRPEKITGKLRLIRINCPAVGSVQAAPVQAVAVQAAPVQTVAIQATPAPVQTAPVQTAPVQTAPVITTTPTTTISKTSVLSKLFG